MEDTYTRCAPASQLDVGAVQGVGPPTLIATSPTSPLGNAVCKKSPSPVIRAGHVTSVGLPCHVDVPSDDLPRLRAPSHCFGLLGETCCRKAGQVRRER